MQHTIRLSRTAGAYAGAVVGTFTDCNREQALLRGALRFPSYAGAAVEVDTVIEGRTETTEGKLPEVPADMVAAFVNDKEGLAAFVRPFQNGWLVLLLDTDAGQMYPTAAAYLDQEVALAKAREAALVNAVSTILVPL